jgi:peptidyl-prolyl cis-trans isomerase C
LDLLGIGKIAMKTLLTLLFVVANLFALDAAFAQNVATVNGKVITEAKLARAVQQSGLPDSPALRSGLKTQLITLELFRQEATKQKLLTAPEVQAAVTEARDNAMIQQYLRAAIKPHPVSDEQVQAHFEKIVFSLGDNEYKPRLILVKDEPTAQSLLVQLKAGADFAKLARESSKAPSATHGGELDWVSFKLPLVEGNTHGYPFVLAEAIAKLPAGGVSAQAIVIKDQYYLVKIDAVRPTVVPQYEQVKPTLKALLERQELERATAQLVVGLIKNAKIQQ